MEFVSEKEIKLDRELSLLDKFALDFIKVLEKHTAYVIVSGYVSILLGRARVSEDIDVIIPKLSKEEFESLHKDLDSRFYCLNAETIENIFEYLLEGHAIRFAKKDTVIPNMELKFAKNRIEKEALSASVEVRIKKNSIRISPMELQIAFKESVLKSPKDMEDARHLRNITNINEKRIQSYKRILNELY